MKLFAVVALSAGIAMGSAWAGSQDAGPPSSLPPQQAFGIYGMDPGVSRTPSTPAMNKKKIQLIALRREALELREKDGGTLTPEHYAMLQAKLDRINAER